VTGVTAAAQARAALFDRQQRTREAFYDGMVIGDQVRTRALESAIETATRVRADREVRRAAWEAYEARTAPMEGPDDPEFVFMLEAALGAAGFEVEE
jgi:hypothetical protein